MIKYWTVEGKFMGIPDHCAILHRDDGPAAECQDGTKIWYYYNTKHRLDGPAIEWEDGSKEWYIRGKEFSEDEFNDISPILQSAESDDEFEMLWRLLK